MPYKAHVQRIKTRITNRWRKFFLLDLAIALLVLILIQMVMPWDRLPLYTTIDGVSVSGKSINDTVKELDGKYDKLPIALYFGNSAKPYRQPFPDDIGLKVESRPQVDAKTYSWWLRLIPTSLWWAHLATPNVAPSYEHNQKGASTYVEKELGQSCDVTPKNATLSYKDKKLEVVSAIDGGTCKLSDVHKLLMSANPRLNQHKITIPMNQRPAKIQDVAAKKFAATLASRSKSASIRAGNSDIAVPQDTLFAWLDFAAPDSGLVATVNVDRAAEFFDKQLAPKVTVKSGTSKVTTLDFTEISRVNGPAGQALDNEATIQAINAWLGGASEQLAVKVKAVAPTVAYTRTYTATDEGMNALITQFAQSHGGSFGVSFAELDGQRRHASYQGTKAFRTASTYKLFVAFGTLKRIESGQWHWSDQIHGGRDLTKCFDDMIVKSDNPCAETLLSKIGYKTLTNELRAIGLNSSSFLGSFPATTANDLTTFVGSLQSGQLLSPGSTTTLISAMKRNIYRQGIPKGAKGQVADKVGFLDAFLHDAAVVYSPTGTYALTIMTEGSSWATMADLTRQIEALRTQ